MNICWFDNVRMISGKRICIGDVMTFKKKALMKTPTGIGEENLICYQMRYFTPFSKAEFRSV